VPAIARDITHTYGEVVLAGKLVVFASSIYEGRPIACYTSQTSVK
jgi:hypothetical protein